MRDYSLAAGLLGRLIIAGRSPTWVRLAGVHIGARVIKLSPPATSDQTYYSATFCAKGNQASLKVMSSDNAYSNFLEQANQDTGASNGSVKPDTINTKSVDTEVPVQLQNVEQYYTSETDEPFEPVSLKWTGLKLPSESESSQYL